jgi:hypothetical protein
MFPLTFQQGWCREKTGAFEMAPSFTWNGARRETRVIDSTWNQVSVQRGIAIVDLVCFLTLLTLFGSKYIRVVHALRIQITVKTKITRHCAPPRNYGLIAQFEHQLACKLHATCSVRLADTSVIIFEFRVMYLDAIQIASTRSVENGFEYTNCSARSVENGFEYSNC